MAFPPGLSMGQLQSPRLPPVSRTAPSQNEGQSGQADTLKGRSQGYRAGLKPSISACRVQAEPRTPRRATLLSTRWIFPPEDVESTNPPVLGVPESPLHPVCSAFGHMQKWDSRSGVAGNFRPVHSCSPIAHCHSHVRLPVSPRACQHLLLSGFHFCF